MARYRLWTLSLCSALILNMAIIMVISQEKGLASQWGLGSVVVDDFSHYALGSLSMGFGDQWRIFSLTNFETNTYRVEEENGNKFLRAIVRRDLEKKLKAVTLIKRLFRDQDRGGKKMFYMPKDYPYLSWKWRIHQLPSGSDERTENETAQKSDSAAGVYIYFQKEGQNPNIIKYIWSETLETGSRFISPASKDIYEAHLVVLHKGEQGLGEWHQEKINIYEDFKKEFGNKKEPPRILGIGILTDADSTDTQAMADYDDFILLSR